MKVLYIFFLYVLIASQVLAQADSTNCDLLHCNEEAVGIGTVTVPEGYRLAVKGKVIMENGRVEVASKWPDYVFEKDYALASLAEVKKYIEANGHLPQMPAAAAVKKEGIDVAAMNILLMQKIEELSLHIIQLQERLNQLNPQQQTGAVK